MKSTSRVRADLALWFITAIWGATFVTVKGALQDADTFSFLALRFTLGAVAAALVARRALLDARVWKSGSLLGLLMFAGYALQTLGLSTISASRSAFITGLTVVFVPLASLLLSRGEVRLPRSTLASIPLAALGLWWLTGASLSDPFSRGDLLTLGCAVAYGFHIALTGRLNPELAPMAVVTVQLAVTALLSALALPFTSPHVNPTTALLGAVVLTGLLASTLAIAIQVWAQARTSAVRAAVIYSLEPVFAVAWSVLLGLGWPQRSELLGGGLVIAAVLLSELGGAPGPVAPRPSDT